MPKNPSDARKEWAAAAREEAQEVAKAVHEAPSAAYDPSPEEEAKLAKIEAKSDWDRLVTVARIKFPDHLAIKFNLTSEQRRCCVAHCIGWSQNKISQVSGRNYETVVRWLKKEESAEFIKAFEYHNGTRDNKEVIDSEVYNSIQVLRDLRDSVQVSPSTRADIAKWFIEQKFGKAKESKEVKGISLRDLTEQLRSDTKDSLDLTLAPQVISSKKEEAN